MASYLCFSVMIAVDAIHCEELSSDFRHPHVNETVALRVRVQSIAKVRNWYMTIGKFDPSLTSRSNQSDVACRVNP